MRVVYLGSEVPSNRKVLVEAGVTHHGWSYMRARKRGFPKTKPFTFSNYYPEGSVVDVHPGTSEVKPSELDEIAADYQDFIVEHLDEIDSFMEIGGPGIPKAFVEAQRPFWETLGDKFRPIYDGSGRDALTSLAQRYEHVVIPHDVLESDTSLSSLTRNLSAQYGTVWHGMSIATPENLRAVQFESASTLSWASPMMRGETIVWDGMRLVRFPKDQRLQAKQRYRSVVEKAGLDVESFMSDDDTKETTRLAIWSFQTMAKSMSKHRPAQNPNNPFHVVTDDDEATGEWDNGPVENLTEMLGVGHNGSPGVGHSDVVDLTQRGNMRADVGHSDGFERQAAATPPAVRDVSERRWLPSIGVREDHITTTAEDGQETVREVLVLGSKAESQRQCDTCFVSANCPAFKPATECAYHLPVEIRTRAQIRALVNTIIEMQGARVLFAKFVEDVNGGYPDPVVGTEMDRLFRLLGKLHDMEDNREFARITIERQGEAGMLSALFGERASVLTELPAPADPVKIIQELTES